jgi:hypothetical protein
MKKPLNKQASCTFLFAAGLLLVATMASCEKAATAKKTADRLNIQGYGIGMTLREVKHLLREKNVKGCETSLSDLFVYNPSPDSEIRLIFTCGAKGYVLARVELSTALPMNGAGGPALTDLKEKLAAEYGTPLVEQSEERLDLCWGACARGSGGVRLTAATTALKKNKRTLSLTLGNDALIQACKELRPNKINDWLYRWIGTVQKFKPGMSLKDASKLYEKRYHDTLAIDEEREEASPGHSVTNYVAQDCDFFAALDYESQSFEGSGPGAVVLKFTGDQAGHDHLNKRLYHVSFSTTKFTDKHLYSDVQQKLDKFIKAYGSPAEIVRQPDGVTARWQRDAQQRSLSIFDSGLITFEQSDQALKEAYRNDVAGKTNR